MLLSFCSSDIRHRTLQAFLGSFHSLDTEIESAYGCQKQTEPNSTKAWLVLSSHLCNWRLLYLTLWQLHECICHLFPFCRCKEGYQGVRCDQFLPKTDSILSDPSRSSFFFLLLLLSPAGCRQSFPPAMVINSAEGCILPLWLWVSESCWSQRLMTDVHVQNMLHVNMSHSSAAMGLSSSSHIYSLLWPPSGSSSYPANSRTQRRLERNNQPYYLSKKCCENYGIMLGFALWPVICDSAKPVNVYLLKRGST